MLAKLETHKHIKTMKPTKEVSEYDNIREQFKLDNIIFNMSYDDFIKWREDGYMSYLIDFSKSKIYNSDYDSLVKFNSGNYDSYDDFTKQSILATLRAVVRYIQIDCEPIDYKTYKRDKNINDILG